MSEWVWTFKAGDFKIVCEEKEALFIDPLVHAEIIIDLSNTATATPLCKTASIPMVIQSSQIAAIDTKSYDGRSAMRGKP